MASEKILRPDSGTVKSMIAAAKRIDSKLQEVQGSEEAYRRAAQTAAQSLYDDRIRKELEQMDVEHLNSGKLGIRTSLLRNAGIETVWQASQLSYQQICDVDGLGEQSAQKIQEVIKQITENTRNTTRIRIQIEDPGQVDDALIRSLYQMLRSRPLREQAKDLYRRHHDDLQQELRLAKQATNGLGWLFKGKGHKQQIVDAVDSLQTRLCGEFGDGVVLDAWTDMEQVSLDTCWQDYRRDASAYYAQLEGLGLCCETQDAAPGGLPAQLAAEIDAQPLHLENLKATLRNYQTFGTKYIVHQKKTLLGDEMGLGKTMQAIAAMVSLSAEGQTHFMVVCPASVLINWCREVQKFSTLQATKIHGNDEDALRHWLETGGVAVTTYESISRFTLPEDFRISMVVTDEAHYVKNPDTLRTKALLKLLKQTENILFMSGTPLENRAEEMCFLVSCLQPEIAKKLELVKFISTAEQFRQQLAPVYLRRTREDVLQELPDLIEKEQWCTLSKAEQKAYKEAVNSENLMAIRQVSWQMPELKDSSKATRLLELCEQAKEQNRKVIVFSFFRNTLQKVTQLLGDRCMEPITGAISPQKRQEIVDAFNEAPDGSVLVSQVQAGGTGLNIQCASVIIFCEPQIKPSIENQAISRAYRMGQVRDVLVYRLLADDTIDERIMEILQGKQQQFDSFADKSVVGEESLKTGEETWVTRLVAEEKQRLQEVPENSASTP